jgi:uncharacterized damage-inducible protein DinB
MDMAIGASLLPEFDQEMASTRKVLERVPLERGDWKPHAKSYSVKELASHIVTMVSWGSFTLATEELDFSTSDFKAPSYDSSEELLAAFDKNAAETRAALEAADDAAYGVIWTMKDGDQVFFSMPRIAVLRSMVFNHGIHHRAQLTVYLRLLDVPVPGVYGPSADEK